MNMNINTHDVSGLLRLRLERSMSARRALRPSSKAACYPLGSKEMCNSLTMLCSDSPRRPT